MYVAIILCCFASDGSLYCLCSPKMHATNKHCCNTHTHTHTHYPIASLATVNTLVDIAFLPWQMYLLPIAVYTHKHKRTCTLNFHIVPTMTPGTGPKWLDGTMVHCLVRPTHAMPCIETFYDIVYSIQSLGEEGERKGWERKGVEGRREKERGRGRERGREGGRKREREREREIK